MPKPLDYSAITDDLFIAAWPKNEHAAQIAGLGVRLVIDTQWEPAATALNEPPLTLLRLTSVDTPLTFVPLDHLLRAAAAARPVLAAGDKVLACCKSGRRRSVAVAAAILVAQGWSLADATARITAARPVAQPDNWWVRRRLRQFEQAWREGQGQPAAG